MRALRGHKTDRIDAARIAEFLQYGLLRGSFVPPRSIRELRDLTRSRVHLQQDRNRVINRIGRLLETANVKLGSVASNIVGASGRAILAAIVAGRTQPEQLAERALGSLQAKKTELALALQGRYSEHFRWLLGRLLQELEWLDDRVLSLDARLSERLQSCTDLVRRLDGIPGVDRVTAWALIAELGLDMRQFPDAAHVASWAGLCPGNQKSAGKRFSGRTRKGDRYLRRLLTQSAWAVLHKDNCFLTALFYRVARRRGEKKAAIAVGHRILTIAYQIIRDGGEYREIGGDYFDRLHPERTVARLTRRLERFGYTVLLHARNEEPDSELLPAPRRRGRPCLCAARGLPCAHTRNNQLAPAASPSATASPLRTRPVHTAPPTPPSLQPCSKCQKWGVPCIHARNQKLHAPPSTSAPESVT